MAQGTHWPKRRWALMGGVVFALGVTVRLVFLLEARHNPLYQCPTIDERTHHEIAKAIAEGTAPSTAYLRAPAYLYFLGGIYKVTGPDSLMARYVQAVVASLAPVLVFLIGGRLFGPWVGVLSGVLSAVFWTFVFFSTELLDVSVACVLYLLLAYVLVTVADGRWWKWLLGGGLLGLGAITRPNVLVYAPVLAVVVVWVARRRLLTRSTRTLPAAWLRIGLSRVALLTLGCAAAIAPVTVRNLLVSGEPILIAAWGPAVFWAANNSDSDARQMCPPPLDTTTSPILQDLLEDPWFIASKLPQCLYIYAARQLGHRPSYSEGSSFYARLSLAYVRDYPGKLLSDAFRRFCYTFNAYECPLNKDLYSFLDFSRLLSALSYLHFGVICPVGVVGLLLMVARRTWPEGLAYYIAMIAALALSGTLFPVFARYRLPVVYLLMPMVAYGVVELAGRIARPTDWRRLLKPVALLAGLAVLSNANVFGFRPAHTEYLLFHFAAASVAAGRHDLVARTSDEIERALADPSRAERVATGPLEEFFKYFHDRDDVPRAARYAREMMRRGAKVDPRMLGGMMKIFIRAGWRDEAERALSALENATAGRPDPYLALAMLRYGRAYRDQDALAGAADLYGALLRLHPDHDKLRDGLTAARQALADLQTRPSSKPAGSRPVR